MNRALHHIEENFNSIIKSLSTLVEIPSISFEPYPKEELTRSAEAVRDLFKNTGIDHVEIITLDGVFPYVYAEHITDPSLPTLLLYAHHDVQPPMREEIWNTPPFKAVEKEGRLYGRGTADDKAGVVVHAASIEAMLKSETPLGVNVKILIEGEEEIGSPNLGRFIELYKEKLSADAIIITDATNFDTGLPTLTTSLRGMVCLEVEVSALESPLHSGLWGGPIPDPAMGLCKILSALTEKDGRVALPELYKTLVQPTEQELESYKKLNMTNELFSSQAKVLPGVELFGNNEELLLRLWREPSLIVNSMESGSRKSAGNVIMNSAWARIGIRLPAGIDSKMTEKLLIEKIKKETPWGLQVTLKTDASVDGWITDTSAEIFSKACDALTKGYGREAVFAGCGASIPLADELSSALGGVPTLLMGIEDPYTNAHSENESLDLEDFRKAIISQVLLFQSFN